VAQRPCWTARLKRAGTAPKDNPLVHYWGYECCWDVVVPVCVGLYLRGARSCKTGSSTPQDGQCPAASANAVTKGWMFFNAWMGRASRASARPGPTLCRWEENP
jgi:hypothetical protein